MIDIIIESKRTPTNSTGLPPMKDAAQNNGKKSSKGREYNESGISFKDGKFEA
jgi:hypothetical protein